MNLRDSFQIKGPTEIPDVVICPYCHYWDAAWDKTEFGHETVTEMQLPRYYRCIRCSRYFKAAMTDTAPYFKGWEID